MKQIPLTQGYVAIVDDDDFERASQFKWSAHLSRDRIYGYRTVRENGRQKHIWLHKFIAGITDSTQVDHIDRDTLNCRRLNLRPATRSQNLANRGMQRNNRSGFRGVFWLRAEKGWMARIQVEGKQYRIGVFKNPTEAARAYDARARAVFGEFAELNFP